MAIERYNGGATPFQQISPTGYSAQAQTMSSLSGKLSEWGERQYQRDIKEVTEEGQQQAIADMTSGEPAKLEKGYSFYADAYNTVAKAAYNIEVESDLKKKAVELESSDPLNHEKFVELFDSYTNGAINKIEDPNFKAIYWKQAKKIGATTRNSMLTKAHANDLKNQEDVLNAGLAEYKTSYEASFATDNVADMTDNLAKYHAILENKANMGLINRNLIPFEMKKMQKGAQENKSMLQLDNSIKEGKTDFISTYMKSPEYQALSFDEKTAITKRMHDHIDVSYKAMNDEALGADKYLEATSKRTSIDVMKKVYSGQEVSDQSLQSMVADGSLSKTDYDRIAQDVADLKGGSSVDDSQVVTYYNLHIESISPRTISQDSRITAKTKQSLISKVISHQRTISDNKQAADAMRGFVSANGAKPYKLGTDYLKTHVFHDDPDKEGQIRNDLLNKVRMRVSKGEITEYDVPDAVEQEAEKYNIKTKDSQMSSKYDREVKKYNDDVTQYRLNTKGAFNQVWNKLGKPLPAPVAPAKPANYIPKDRRN